MAHANEADLAKIAVLLRQLRALPGVKEAGKGVLHAGGAAFIHFHADDAGMSADLRRSGPRGGFDRFAVNTPTEQRKLVDAARLRLAAMDDD